MTAPGVCEDPQSDPADAEARVLVASLARDANAGLRGESLRAAAKKLIALASGMTLSAVDRGGERIIGAALAIDDTLTVGTAGSEVLLVSGYTFGDGARRTAAGRASASGATRIELAVMDSCGPIEDLPIHLIGDVDASTDDLVDGFAAAGWVMSSLGPAAAYVRFEAPDSCSLADTSVIVPLNPTAPDFSELRSNAVRTLRAARALATADGSSRC